MSVQKFSLSIWTVYDHPSDLPNNWVARRFVIEAADFGPTDDVIITTDLAQIRDEMQRRGLTYMPRFRDDDPKIFECWI